MEENRRLTEKTYLSVRETAEYLGYSPGYIYRLASLNVLPHYAPNGGRILFNRLELDEWVANNGRKTNGPKSADLIIR